MKEYYGNHLGLCINNDDPEKRGRVQIFIPHIMPALFKDWNEVGEDIQMLCVGDNLPDSLPGYIVEKLIKMLPWAECASPILGDSAPGQLVSQGGQSYYNQSPISGPVTAPGGGTINNAVAGGIGGNWSGSLDKLSQIMPAGSWTPTSQKRSRKTTASGGTSDHWDQNEKSYAIDIGLNSTFGGNSLKARQTAIQIVNNVRAQRREPPITSWDDYRGSSYTALTPDGYRVQVIWEAKDHYDHIHVGVRSEGATAVAPYIQPGQSGLSLYNSSEYTSLGGQANQTPQQSPNPRTNATGNPTFAHTDCNHDGEHASSASSSAGGSAGAATTGTSKYRDVNTVTIGHPRVKAIRANNPGNLHEVGTPYIGQITSTADKGGRVAHFDTLGNGMAQNINQIGININRGYNTIGKMAGSWTGTSGGKAASIAQTWSTWSGIGINDALDINNKAQIQALLQGIGFNEASGIAPNFQQGFDEGWNILKRRKGLDPSQPWAANSFPGGGSPAAGSMVAYTDPNGPTVSLNINNMAKGVFTYPSAGALLWVFFREGNPLFPVYFAANYGQREWQSAFRQGSDAPGIKPAATPENPITSTGTKINWGVGGIEVINTTDPNNASNNQKSVMLYGSDGSNMFMNEGYHQIFSKFDRRDQVDGSRWQSTLGTKEELVQSDYNSVTMGDRIIKVGNFTTEAMDAVDRIHEIIKEIMKPLTETSGPSIRPFPTAPTERSAKYLRDAIEQSKKMYNVPEGPYKIPAQEALRELGADQPEMPQPPKLEPITQIPITPPTPPAGSVQPTQ